MIKYTKSKLQCSYLKFRVSTRQATKPDEWKHETLSSYTVVLILYTLYI